MFLQEHLDKLKLGDPNFKLSSFGIAPPTLKPILHVARCWQNWDDRVSPEKFEIGL
jgi:hypothetical protein